MNLSNGTIYFDGKPVAKGIPELTLEAEPETTEEPVLKIPKAQEVSFKCKIDDKVLLHLIYGRPITNNWLKMHGGVMRRRRVS